MTIRGGIIKGDSKVNGRFATIMENRRQDVIVDELVRNIVRFDMNRGTLDHNEEPIRHRIGEFHMRFAANNTEEDWILVEREIMRRVDELSRAAAEVGFFGRDDGLNEARPSNRLRQSLIDIFDNLDTERFDAVPIPHPAAFGTMSMPVFAARHAIVDDILVMHELVYGVENMQTRYPAFLEFWHSYLARIPEARRPFPEGDLRGLIRELDDFIERKRGDAFPITVNVDEGASEVEDGDDPEARVAEAQREQDFAIELRSAALTMRITMR